MEADMTLSDLFWLAAGVAMMLAAILRAAGAWS